MQNARSFKRKADAVLVELCRSLFEEIDTEKIRAEAAHIQAAAPDLGRARLARVLVRRTALRCAATGALTGLPSGLLAFGTLGADLAYLVFQQFRMILGIATIYGHEPSERERFTEALSCLAYASGVGIGKEGLGFAVEAVTAESGFVAERVGARMMRDRLAKIIPIVGAVSGFALNYVSVRAVARAAIRYYESKVDPVVAQEIWNEGDREHA